MKSQPKMDDLTQLSLNDAAGLLRSGNLSPVAYLTSFLERIDRYNHALDAFIAIDHERSLLEASKAEREIAQGGWRGPLHGVPVALKDIVDVAGQRTSAHSKIRFHHIADRDAFVVSKLRQAGAIIIGKTALHEFATGGPSFDLPWPPARNPWNRSHHPGGSSSGSGVAIAAGFAPVALGTDTGGSVRHPASACGITGMKPTYGAVSRTGAFPLSFSLDHIGPMTRNVRDNVLVLEALLGRDPQDVTSVDHPNPSFQASLDDGVKGLRLGVLDEFGALANPEIRSAFLQACATLEGLGAELVPLKLSPLDTYVGCGRLILQAESFAIHENWLKTSIDAYGRRGRIRLLSGAFLSASDYIRAQQMRTLLSQEFAAAMQTVDAALCVSSLEMPCAIDDEEAVERTYDRQARTPFNLTGSPAISVPMGFSQNGLPIGLQVVGRAFGEAMVYRVAQSFESATQWHLRRPVLTPRNTTDPEAIQRASTSTH